MDWLIEDFEKPNGMTGGFWLEVDKSGLGTEVQPVPLRLEQGTTPHGGGSFAHFHGKLGSNRAPWSWVQLQLFLSSDKHPTDLKTYRSVRFLARGDGGRYVVSLIKNAVKDYDNFRYEFTAPQQWTEIEVPLSSFHQAGWGKQLPAVFDDVTQLHFSPAQFDQPFDIAIDDVVLSGKEVNLEPKAYDTAGWFPWTGTDPSKRRGTALDVSRLLDAPAGKHGPLGRRGDQFVFRDGKPVRFWGINVVASTNFPSHAQADEMAELLAQMGVNMTRHHHMDAAWSHPNVFGNKPSTLELDPTAMERFDYFVAQLQKRGIYQYFDMIVHRKLTQADGVGEVDKLAAGMKIEGEFSERLIGLQERFIKQFMGHKNPYTKTTYAQNPAIALAEIINEDSLLWIQEQGEFAVKTPAYHDELNRLFSKFLLGFVPGGRAALEKRWSNGGSSALLANEDPSKGSVDALLALSNYQKAKKNDVRSQDTLRFLYETQLTYYRRMERVLRGIGYTGLLTGSNHWTENPLDLYANAQLGFVDRHAYHAHPSGGWGYNTQVSWDTSAMVKDVNLGIVGSLARRRVKGSPYATSEWQTSAPNDFRTEGLVLMGAYASLQQFSPLQFALSHDINKALNRPGALSSNFDVLEQPTVLGGWPAVSLLFHRQDVAPSDVDAYLKLDPNGPFAPDSGTPGIARLGLIARTGIDFTKGSNETELTALRDRFVQGTVASSTTKQLRHDSAKGIVLVDTERSQAFVGFAPSDPVELGNLRMKLENRFGVVLVTSLDEAPIAASKRLLITLLGNAVNTGMSLSPSGNQLANPGTAPVLIEPIRARISLVKLAGATDATRAYALGPNGERHTDVKLETAPGSVSLTVTPELQTMHIEVVRP